MSTKDDLICKNCDSYMPGIMKPHEGVCEFYETKVIEKEIICEYFLPKEEKWELWLAEIPEDLQ